MSFVSGRPFYEDADPPRPGLTRWLVPGSLKRHRMGLVGASLGSPRPSSCRRRKAALGTGSFTPPLPSPPFAHQRRHGAEGLCVVSGLGHGLGNSGLEVAREQRSGPGRPG